MLAGLRTQIASSLANIEVCLARLPASYFPCPSTDSQKPSPDFKALKGVIHELRQAKGEKDSERPTALPRSVHPCGPDSSSSSGTNVEPEMVHDFEKGRRDSKIHLFDWVSEHFAFGYAAS